MKLKKITALVMVAIMLMLVGCTKKETNEKTKISILFSEGASAPFKKDWLIVDEIEKRQNVELDIQVVPASDYAAKRSIVLASQDIPDILANTWAGQVSQYANDGLMLPISDYLDKMPNLKRIIKEWNLESTIDDISELDGKFYVLPAFEKEPVSTNGFAIRQDILEKHGLKEPTTYDELADLLLELKKLYPNSLGLGDIYNGNLLMSFTASCFGTKGGYSLPYGYTYDSDKKQWYFAPTSEQYKELLTYFNKLYKSGCLDMEGFTQDSGQFKQKIANSQYLIVPASGQTSAEEYTNLLRDMGNKEAKFKMLYPLAGPHGLRKGKPCSRYVGGVAMPASVAKRKDFDKILSFVDWLYYSEEAAILSKLGKEGVTYEKDGDNYKMKDDIKTVYNVNGTKELVRDFGMSNNGLQTLVADLVPRNMMRLIEPIEMEQDKKYLIDNDMVDYDDPLVKFTVEQTEEAKLLYTTLNDYTNTMMMKFIYGEESFDNWDKYENKCKKLGSDKLISLVKKAWSNNKK